MIAVDESDIAKLMIIAAIVLCAEKYFNIKKYKPLVIMTCNGPYMKTYFFKIFSRSIGR